MDHQKNKNKFNFLKKAEEFFSFVLKILKIKELLCKLEDYKFQIIGAISGFLLAYFFWSIVVLDKNFEMELFDLGKKSDPINLEQIE